MPLTPAYVLVLAVAAFLWATLWAGPRALLAQAVLLILASGSSLLASSAVSIAFRAAAVATLLVLALRFRATTSAPSIVRSLTQFCSALWVMLTFVAVVHHEYDVLASASFGLVALALFIGLAATREGLEVYRVIYCSLVFWEVVSLAAGRLSPSVAVVQGRLRGVTGNANELAFYALVAVALAMFSSGGWRSRTVVGCLSGLVLILTGSRTSTVALVVLIIAATLVQTRSHAARRTVFALGTIVAIAYLSGSLDRYASRFTVLRINNSRQGSLDEARQRYESSPVAGLGFGSIRETIASSPLRALAAGGTVAVVIMVVACAVLLRRAYGLDRKMFVFCFACFVHSLGEGWLVSTSGPMLTVFVLAMISLDRGTTRVVATERPTSVRSARR